MSKRPIYDFVHELFNGAPSGTYIATATFRHRWEQQSYRIEDSDLAVRFLEMQPEETQTYIRLTPVTNEPSPGRRGKASDTAGSFFLWVDIDFHSNGAPVDTKVDAALAGLAESSLPPTFYIRSGRGLHCYWRLKRFETDLGELTSRLRGLAGYFKDYGADPAAADLARVLRPPLSWNIVTSTSATLVLGSGRVYNLADFPAAPAREVILADDEEIVEEPLPSGFIDDLERVNHQLAARILTPEGVPPRPQSEVRRPDGTVDRSRNDYYIVRELHKLGYTPGQILTVLHHPVWFSGERFRDGKHGVAEHDIRSAIADSQLHQNGTFMSGKSFLSKAVVQYLQDTTPIISVDRDLYMYEGGVYKRDTGNLIRHRIWVVLNESDCWTLGRENEVVAHLQSMDDTSIPDLNNYSNKLNVRNGILDLVTFELEPHNPAYLFTIQLPVDYDPNAKSEIVEEFFHRVLYEDTIDVVWEFVGFCFTPSYVHRAILFLIGPPRSGKTTLLEYIRRLLGNANTSALPLETLANSHFALGGLFGMLANINSEVSTNVDLVGTEKIKSLASPGQILSADVKYRRHPLQFESRAKLMFGANRYPAISRVDAATTERFLCIPCERQFLTPTQQGRIDVPGESADIFMLNTLTTPENLSAGLNLALAGLRRLEERRDFSPSETIQNENARFEVEVDAITRFVNEISKPVDIPRGDKSSDEKPKAVYAMYIRWCGDEGIKNPMKKFEFTREIVKRGYVKEAELESGSRVWRGRMWNDKVDEGISRMISKMNDGSQPGHIH
jgi:P4 family phage/plasmid primase-like protien